MTLFDEHVVVLVTGISASGKSTIAEMLAQRFALGVHVRGDLFRRMVRSGREDMAASPSKEALRQLHLRYGLAATVVDTYFDAGFSVVVQDIVIGAALRDYVELIRSRPLLVVALAPRLDAVARREALREKTAYREGNPSMVELDGVLRRQTPGLGLWIDSSEQSPGETVEEIERRASEAVVA